MLVHVNQHDINSGIPLDSTRCPIANALKREFPTKRISVGTLAAIVDLDIISLPPIAQVFIKNFDAEKSVEPFKFVLNSPR